MRLLKATRFAIKLLISLPLIILYIPPLLVLTLQTPQRALLYLHRFHSAYVRSPRNQSKFHLKPAVSTQPSTKPWAERSRISDNQVIPFSIATYDNERLFVWFIWLALPWDPTKRTEKYRHMDTDFRAQLQTSLADEVPDPSRASLLQHFRNGDVRCIIYFHGNAGHVAEPMRLKFYNQLLETPTDHPTFLIAVDYRGFGHSTGTPSEAGLITDGVATVEFVMKRLLIPAKRIVLVGHSLGTAMAAAVYEHFSCGREGEEEQLGGLVLASGFTSVPELLLSYRLGGFIPILGPLKAVPALLRWFQHRIVDKWETGKRLRRVLLHVQKWNVLILHSRNDWEIPCRQSEVLFTDLQRHISRGDDDDLFGSQETENTEVVSTSDEKRLLRLMLVDKGGHDGSIYQPEACKVVLDMFDLGKTRHTNASRIW